MEYLTPHIILRKGLIRGVVYPLMARHIGEFMAETLFKTSDFYLPAARKKGRMALFCQNTQLCKITEDLVFTDPYRQAPLNRHTTPQLDGVARSFQNDGPLKFAAQELKYAFLRTPRQWSTAIYIQARSWRPKPKPALSIRNCLLRADGLRHRCFHCQPAAGLVCAPGPHPDRANARSTATGFWIRPKRYGISSASDFPPCGGIARLTETVAMPFPRVAEEPGGAGRGYAAGRAKSYLAGYGGLCRSQNDSPHSGARTRRGSGEHSQSGYSCGVRTASVMLARRMLTDRACCPTVKALRVMVEDSEAKIPGKD